MSTEDLILTLEKEQLLNCPICNAEPRDASFGIECTQCGLWLPVGSKWNWNDRGGHSHLIGEENEDISELDISLHSGGQIKE